MDAHDDLDRCDLDPTKICDSCCKCIETESDYIAIPLRFVADGAGGEKEKPPSLPGSVPRKRRWR